MNGQIVTVAGTGTAGRAADGQAANAAAIAEPFGLVIAPDGCLVFCDLGNHRICRVTSNELTVFAGNGQPGGAGDGGPALAATMLQPYEVRFDRAGNLHFVDMPNHVVRRVDAETGHIETVAGCGAAGYGGDGGDAKRAKLNQPHSIEIDAAGAIYVADIGNHRIRRVDPQSGIIETFAGTGEQAPTQDGAAIGATPLNGPRALAFDENEELYLTLREGNAVYRIDRQHRTIHHVAGTGTFGYSGDGGDAKAAKLSGPKGIAVDSQAIYIADTESHTIRRIDRRTGAIHTVAGTGKHFDGADGDPLACGLARPHGVCSAGDHALFIGDSDNHRVRKLSW